MSIARFAALPVFFAFLACSCQTFGHVPRQPTFGATSPDGALSVTVTAHGKLAYQVTLDGAPLLAPSRLGLAFADGLVLGENTEVLGVERRAHDAVWKNDFGKCSAVRDRFNEARIRLKELRPAPAPPILFDVVVRAYDDGVALRYDLPRQAGLEAFTLTGDRTEFVFPQDARALGGAWSDCGEMHYPETRLGRLPESRMCLPLVAQTPAATVALAESDVRDWSCSFLKRAKGSGAGGGPVVLEAQLASRVASRTPRVSPWHFAMVGRKPGSLVESNLMQNLATPSQVADTSWIKPGTMAWDDWWTGINPHWDKYRGLGCRGNTASHMGYQDLAADMGWTYQLVDWFWYDQDGRDPETAIKPQAHIDMPAMFAHAKARGVKLVLWVNSKNIHSIGAEKLFATYAAWGAAGVKIDFFNGNGSQPTVKWQEELLAIAAKHRLLVDFHGTAVPTGLSRTWPNLITQEGIKGNEYNKCGQGIDCSPKHAVTLPFTRCLLGPGDFTPGGFVNVPAKDFRQNAIPCQVVGTRARQLALAVCVDSPLLCMADSPANYRTKDGFAPGLEFFRDLPTVWDETRVLSADLAEHLVEARRKGDAWVVAAMNNDKPLTLKVPLNFLGKGEYTVRVFADKPESGTKPAEITDEVRTVKAGDVLEIPMATHGGFAAKFAPKK